MVLSVGIRAEVVFGSVRYVRYCTEFLLGTRYGIRYKEGLATSILDTMFGTRGRKGAAYVGQYRHTYFVEKARSRPEQHRTRTPYTQCKPQRRRTHRTDYWRSRYGFPVQ